MVEPNQAEYNRRWANKNPERDRYLRVRSIARSFIRNRVTAEDVAELRQMLNERERKISEISAE